MTRVPGDVLAAHTALGWSGMVLPKTRVSTSRVYPVVQWTPEARQRTAVAPAPMTDRPTLCEWEIDGPSSPLQIVGFLSDRPSGAAINQLRSLAGYGAGAVLVRSARRLSSWTFAEADMAGVALVEMPTDGASATVTLQGRSGPAVSARRTVGTRLREEQLFAWTISCGISPCLDAVPV